MKRKEDIYKKPKKLLSEYLAIVLVSGVTALFISFEMYSFISSDKQTAELTDVDIQKPKEELELNKSIPLVEKVELSKQPKELILDENSTKESDELALATTAEDTNLSSVDVVAESALQESLENPIEEVLTLKLEDQVWKLQSTYSNYSVEDKHRLLVHAIENNHAQNLTKMFTTDYRLTTEFYEGDANKLIFTRKYKVVFILLRRNLLDLEKTNKYGYSLLHEASSKGYKKLIELIISKGHDINVQANDGASVLHYPSRLGHKITVKTLLGLGINPNLTATLQYKGLYWNESAPLHIATKRGHLKIVKLLVAGGADLDLKDGDGNTALDIAKEINHEDLIDFLQSEASTSEKEAPVDMNETTIEAQTSEDLSFNSSDEADSSSDLPYRDTNSSISF